MNFNQWFRELHRDCCFMSVEVSHSSGAKRASNSEIQRWIEQGSLHINGERVTPKEDVDFPVFSVVLFPNSKKRRCTLL